MNSRTAGLRVSSVIFGLISLSHIVRLGAQVGIVIGGYHLGQIPSFIAIAITGGLSIWLAKLAGPWFAETRAEPTPKV